MTRTLTAGIQADPEPKPKFRYAPEEFQPEVETMIWSCILDLWRLGRRRRELATKAGKLDAWLNRAMAFLNQNPSLDDIEERRRIYGARRVRHRDLVAEIEGIDRTAEQLKASLATHWDRLRPQRQAALRKESGWSRSTSSVRIAAELWDYAKRGLPMPSGEPPFGLIGVLVMIGGMLS